MLSRRISLLALLALGLALTAIVIRTDWLRENRATTLALMGQGETIPEGRRLIPPDNDAATYEWLLGLRAAEHSSWTGKANAAWDNAPKGRDANLPVLVRAGLRVAVNTDQAISKQAAREASVEHTALWAGPAFHVGLILFALVVALMAKSDVASFLLLCAIGCSPNLWNALAPGLVSETPFALGSGVCALLVLFFFESVAAGIVSGVLLGLSVAISGVYGLPLMVGSALFFCSRPGKSGNVRAWGWSGAVTLLAGALCEGVSIAGLKSGADLLLPLHAVLLIGLGEFTAAIQAISFSARRLSWRQGAAALPIVAFVLFKIFGPESPASYENLWLTSGLKETGFLTFFAWWNTSQSVWEKALVILPVILLGATYWPAWLSQNKGEDTSGARSSWLASAFFVLWTFIHPSQSLFAWLSLSVCLAALLSRQRPMFRAGGTALLASVLALPLLAAWNGLDSKAPTVLTTGEVTALLERDLSLWLSNRSMKPNAIVLAPPSQSLSLAYHGGLRSVISPARNNVEGQLLAARILGTAYSDEARGLLQSRPVSYLVLPSWDSWFDDLIRANGKGNADTFLQNLHRWLAPRYLRSLAYMPPKVSDGDERTAAVFEVVEVQEAALALSRLALFFGEMGMEREARAVEAALSNNFDDDPSSTVARVTLYHQWGETSQHQATFERLMGALGDSDIALDWDIRVVRAIVLAQEKKPEQAKAELQECMKEVSESNLRTLSPLSAYRFYVLTKAFSLPLPKQELKSVLRHLVPVEFKDKIQ